VDCFSEYSVSIALSVTIFELLDAEEYHNFEIYVRGHSRSLEMAPFESFGTVSYLHSIATMAASLAVSTQYVHERDRRTPSQTLHHSEGCAYA